MLRACCLGGMSMSMGRDVRLLTIFDVPDHSELALWFEHAMNLLEGVFSCEPL